MLSLALIERRIKELVKADHSDQNVREFAEMCLARDFLLAELVEQEAEAKAAPKPRLILTDYCADLNRVPNVEEIEAAISAAASSTYDKSGRQRLKDLDTWAKILGKN